MTKMCGCNLCTTFIFQMEEQIERLTTINESLRKTLGASQARISVLAKEKAELQTELRSIKRTKVLQVQTGQDESIEEEGFVDSDNEVQEQISGDEGEEVEEGKMQNVDERPEEVVDLSKRIPPPKPPRQELELEAEQNGGRLNNNENGINGQDKNGRGEHEENELNQNGNDEQHEHDDWEFVGDTPKTAYKREKAKEELKEKRQENQSKVEKDKKDPNRPRYTKAEMLEILAERNNLKERVFALEDELKIYKPR